MTKTADGVNWVGVLVGGKQYYVSRAYLKKSSSAPASSSETVTTYKTTANLNYRSGAGLSYDIKGTLARGSSVSVVSGYSSSANGYTWYKIKIGNAYYYVASTYLTR